MREPLEESLARSIDQLPHPSLDVLSRMPVPLMTEHDKITRQCPGFAPLWTMLAACAAMLLLCLGGGWYYQTRAVASVIDLDINPSFEITANRRDQVIEVIPVNEDAWMYLPDITFRDMPLEDAVGALVESLHRSGYLQTPESVLLLSVGSSSAPRAQRLEQTLSEQITLLLDERQSRAAVVRQRLEGSEAVRGQARECRVSEGRMQLIDQILSQEPAFSRDKLLELSVGELVSLCDRYGFSLEGAPVVPAPNEANPPPAPPISRANVDRVDDHDGDEVDDPDEDDDGSDETDGPDEDDDDGDDSDDPDEDDDDSDETDDPDKDDDGSDETDDPDKDDDDGGDADDPDEDDDESDETDNSDEDDEDGDGTNNSDEDDGDDDSDN